MMKHEKIDTVKQALDPDFLKKRGYKCIWFQEISRAGLMELDGKSIDIDQENLIEARIFGAEENGKISEIHIFEKMDGGLAAVETIEEDGDVSYERPQIVTDRFKVHLGNILTLRYFLGYDDDGQAKTEQVLFKDIREEVK
jgi:hypothetical protein